MDLFDEHTKQIPSVKIYVLGRKDPVDKAGDMIQRAGGVIDVDNRVLVRAIRKGKRDRNDGSWMAWEKKFWQRQAGFLTKPPDSDADSDEDEVDVEEEDNEDDDEHEDPRTTRWRCTRWTRRCTRR